MRERKPLASFEPLVRMAVIFGAVGALLFVRVWWPIQAERSLSQLRKVEARVFQKKSELNILNERIADMTSLTVLDQWAKKHGPWVNPTAENVIPLS